MTIFSIQTSTEINSPFIYWITLLCIKTDIQIFPLFIEWPFYAYRQKYGYYPFYLLNDPFMHTDRHIDISPYLLNDPFMHTDRHIDISPYLLNDPFIHTDRHIDISPYLLNDPFIHTDRHIDISPYLLNDPFMHTDRHIDISPYLSNDPFIHTDRHIDKLPLFLEVPFIRTNRHTDWLPFIYLKTLLCIPPDIQVTSPSLLNYPLCIQIDIKIIPLIYWKACLCIGTDIQRDSPYLLNDPFMHTDGHIDEFLIIYSTNLMCAKIDILIKFSYLYNWRPYSHR